MECLICKKLIRNPDKHHIFIGACGVVLSCRKCYDVKKINQIVDAIDRKRIYEEYLNNKNL
jgi:hypothetical protein